MKRTSYSSGSAALIIGGDFHGLGVARNLADLGVPVIIVHPGFSISRYSRCIDEYFTCPPLDDGEAFTDFLQSLAVKKGLGKTVLFPTSDIAVHTLANHRDRLERHYLVPTPPWEITRLTYDKTLTHRIATESGIPVPRTFFPADETDLRKLDMNFPVILKPAVTQNFFPVAKLKAIRANDFDELFRGYAYVASIIDKSEIMVQELIEGGPKNLYSFCSLFGNGTVKAKIMARRLRQHPMDFGSASTYAITCNIPEMEELATRFLRKINYYGLSEVEFMFDEKDSTFKLLEINARTWAWHTLGAKAGVNFSALLFLDMHNEPVRSDSFEEGVKWIREATDVPVVITEVLKRRMSLKDYLDSMKGKKVLAVYASSDPLPFITELFWAPYMWYKRGFRM